MPRRLPLAPRQSRTACTSRLTLWPSSVRLFGPVRPCELFQTHGRPLPLLHGGGSRRCRELLLPVPYSRPGGHGVVLSLRSGLLLCL